MNRNIDSLGRIVIPKEIRKKLGIKENDSLRIETENNKIILYKDCIDSNDLQEKYNKALELLCSYDMPCENDDFMNKNTNYCSKNCSVDDEVFKKCWDRFIEQNLEGEQE